MMPLPQHMIVERLGRSGWNVQIDGEAKASLAFTDDRDLATWFVEQVRGDFAEEQQPSIDEGVPPTGGYPRVVAGREPTNVDRGFWRGKK